VRTERSGAQLPEELVPVLKTAGPAVFRGEIRVQGDLFLVQIGAEHLGFVNLLLKIVWATSVPAEELCIT
jgi:hypothetical protein